MPFGLWGNGNILPANYRHSRAEGAGIQHSRESAPALAGAKAGILLRFAFALLL